MITWDENLDEKQMISSEENPLVIDFGDTYIIHSKDIRKLLIVQKDTEKKNKKLIFKTQNSYLIELFKDFGFIELGVEIQVY